MKYLTLTVLAFATAAGTARANDHLTGIRDHARELSIEFRAMQEITKAKKADLSSLQPRLESSAERIGELKALVAAFEASHPEKTAAAEWKATRDLVALIDLFHSQKLEVIQSGKPDKSRARTYAAGLVVRSDKLQNTADLALKALAN